MFAFSRRAESPGLLSLVPLDDIWRNQDQRIIRGGRERYTDSKGGKIVAGFAVYRNAGATNC